jgi:uncharacterized protein YdaU (DUF1376 family)
MVGKIAPWMAWYGDDFYMDDRVQDMDLEQQGAYQKLLWCAWRDGSIPSDGAVLARRLGVTLARFRRIWAAIEPCWNPHPDNPDRLTNKRIESERAKKDAVREKRREAGRRGGQTTQQRLRKVTDAS